MKSILLSFVTMFVAFTSFAQTIDDGKRFLYYERYKSAKDHFSKIIATNPSDETAAYYLGQSMIGLEDVAGAKALYQQKLSATPNSPLLLAGMGHVALLEGKTADARNRFETAVSLSGGKRIDVLNAIGAPNSDPDVKSGDAAYAVEKLRMATTIKGFKDPEVLTNLGDAYRKIGDGGNAILSYDAALAINPNYVRAIYRKGRLYQSQGPGQEGLYTGFYNTAIAKDANYAPVYNTLYNYYYETNVPRSAEYLNKWLNVSDDDPKACYSRASIKYAQGLFAEAITKANECIAVGGMSVYPNLYGVKALAANRLGDSVTAKASYEEYFKKQIPAKIGAGDYSAYAMILLKFPGNEALAASYVDKAVALDSTEANRVNYLKALGAAFVSQKNFSEAARWYEKILAFKRNYTNVDIYNAGYNYYRARIYDSSILAFKKYTIKYPEDMFGYYMLAKATSGIDSTGNLGTSEIAYLKAVEIGEKAADKEKIKVNLTEAYLFLRNYYYDVKKDQTTALLFADKGIALDSLNQKLKDEREIIKKNDPKLSKPQKPVKPVQAIKPQKK